MLEIDGGYGEGGGQILRTALALAALLGKSVHVTNIRQGRPVPGLKAQHLASVQAIAALCSAKVEGLRVGSTDLKFDPGPLKNGSFRFYVGTAGSITLVLQSLMPIAPFVPGDCRIEVTGGTDVKWSPPIDYLKIITLPILQRMGYSAELQVERRGHYPKGGGLVKFQSYQTPYLTSMRGDHSGPIHAVSGISHSVQLPPNVAVRQAMSARQFLLDSGLPDPKIEIENSNSNALGPGSGIVLSATGTTSSLIGADNLGERGVAAEKVGALNAKRLVEETTTNAYLDSHMGDIIVPYLALAKGTSRVTVSRITQHLITNVKVVEELVGVRFAPYGELGKPGTLEVNGNGFSIADADASPTVR